MIFAYCQTYGTISIYDADTYEKQHDYIVNGGILSIRF